MARQLAVAVLLLLGLGLAACQTTARDEAQGAVHAGDATAAAEPLHGGGGWWGTYNLGITQTVRVTQPTAPLRLPVCLAEDTVNTQLQAAINGLLRHKGGQANLTTALFQVKTTCTYRSVVIYSGPEAVKGALLAALSSHDPVKATCKLLGSYCSSLFGPGSGAWLQGAAGDASPVLPPVVDYGCVKSTFSQVRDHFPSGGGQAERWAQVYWVCDGAWPAGRAEQERSGNVIVFLGNESPLGTPYQPIVFENARRMSALVVLVEHRYYGDSWPVQPHKNQYGYDVVDTPDYRWLTMEQVVADTAAVVLAVRAARSVPEAVPAVVVGGSYGGMLSAYHRVLRPDVFAAAVAASAPVQYILSERMWADTSERYHDRITASLDANSGSKACSRTVRKGLDAIVRLGGSADGRRRLGEAFKFCDPGLVRDASAAFALQMEQYYQWAGNIVQVNNQPPLLGAVALACEVVAGARAAGAEPLEAIAAANEYLSSNGSSWCYVPSNLSPDLTWWLMELPAPSYVYQSCTQGVSDTTILPSTGRPLGSAAPRFGLPPRTLMAQFASQCRGFFPPPGEVPPLSPPEFAADIKRRLAEVGGVVFTNGDLDGWGGGSILGPQDMEGEGGGGGLAFVDYGGASHCTDTHTFNWDNPFEPSQYKELRRRAMDEALKFMRPGGGGDRST